MVASPAPCFAQALQLRLDSLLLSEAPANARTVNATLQRLFGFLLLRRPGDALLATLGSRVWKAVIVGSKLEQQGESQSIDSNDEEVEVIGKGAASTAPPAASNDPGRRSSSRASTRSSSRGTSAANTPTFEPNDKDDLIKKASQALIAPYNSSVTSMKSFPTQNGLTPAIVLQLLEDHENSDSDPSVGMLIAALPKECGLTRDDPDHRNMIRHLYRNFRGEDDLLQNKSGDKLSVSSQEKDLCVYALATMPLGKQFTFFRHFIPYRSKADVVKIYRYAEGKGLHHNKEHVAHVKRSIGLIERLEGPIETGEGGANDIDDERKIHV